MEEDNTVKRDYCSCFPDRILGVYIGSCCQVHDQLYDKGGNAEDRKYADYLLRRCITKKHAGRMRLTIVAYIAYFGVRIGGSRWFNDIFRGGKQRFNWE